MMAFWLTESIFKAQLMAAMHLCTPSLSLATPLDPGRVFLELQVIRSPRLRSRFHDE